MLTVAFVLVAYNITIIGKGIVAEVIADLKEKYAALANKCKACADKKCPRCSDACSQGCRRCEQKCRKKKERNALAASLSKKLGAGIDTLNEAKDETEEQKKEKAGKLAMFGRLARAKAPKEESTPEQEPI